MPTFNIYKDKPENFIFIEKNGKWSMGLLESEDEDFIPCPSFDDLSMLVKESIRDYEFENIAITGCNECENRGFILSLDDVEICGCYHGQKHGVKSLDNYIEGNYEIRCGL